METTLLSPAREYRSSAPDCLRGSSLKTEIGKKRELSANNLRYPPRRPHRSVRQAGGPAPRPIWESCSLALELEAAGMGRHGSHSVTESVGRARKRCAVAKCVFPRLVSSPCPPLPKSSRPKGFQSKMFLLINDFLVSAQCETGRQGR